jgi:zinc/manganese transport system permease protein
MTPAALLQKQLNGLRRARPAELALTGAAAGLLVADNPVVGALIGSVVVAVLISVFGGQQSERDSEVPQIFRTGIQ